MRRGSHLSALLGSAALVSGMAAAPALAADFRFGDATLAIDSIASTGLAVRASKQECMYISTANGGCPDGIGQSADVNTDDGNINFDQWDLTSASVKIVSDIELRYQNFGAFTRLRAYYDYVTHQRAGRKGGSSNYDLRPITDERRGDDAKNAGRGIDLLDAFVFANFDVGNVPATLRVGKQVINWGESLLIQGGINQFNAVDVGALRTPGAELKEALLPEESVYASVLLPYDMSLEAFYAFNWRQTELDPVGTFFSGVDIFGPGAAYTNTVDGDGPNNLGLLPLAESDKPSDQGQWGVKLGHYATWLNQGTELGLYYVNYHSKLPYLEYSNGLTPALQAEFGLTGLVPDQSYRAAFPEDIEYVGGSFATTIAGTAVSGELLYSWNMPFQISSGEILAGRWFTNFGGAPVAVLPYDDTPGAFGKGYFRDEVINGQISTITTFNPSDDITQLFNADAASLIVNVGFQHIPSLSDAEKSVLSGGHGSQISHPNRAIMHNNAGPFGPVFNPAQPLVKADTTSWGYRTILNFTYNNAFGTPWSLTPGVQWAHDLGTSAGMVGPGFLKDRKTVSVGVTADLQSVWRAELRYTNSFGNRFQNTTSDRDFISASVSYAF